MPQREKFITFSVGETKLGIPIDRVVEVVKIDADEVDMVSDIAGLTKINEKSIPLIDIAGKFAHNIGKQRKNEKAIIVRDDCVFFGLLAGSNIDIAEVEGERIFDVPSLLKQNPERSILSAVAVFNEKPLLILDLKNIYRLNELKSLDEGTNTELEKNLREDK